MKTKRAFLGMVKTFGLLLPLSIPTLSFAQQSAPAIYVTGSTLDSALFCPVINTMFFILIGVSVIMVMWAAYLYLTAGDDTEKVHKATKTITYAAIAIIVALIAYGFPSLISDIFNQTSSFTCH